MDALPPLTAPLVAAEVEAAAPLERRSCSAVAPDR